MIISEFEFLKSRNLNYATLYFAAREIDSKWRMFNPDDDSKNRVRLVIEKDIPDLWGDPSL